MPPGSGFIKDGVGWLPNIVANASAATTFYSTFDVSSHGAFSAYPRVYKRISYTPTGTGGAVATIDTIPVFTAIINVERGVVTGVAWDDGCFFCADNGPDCMASALDANATGPFTTLGDAGLRGCRQTNDACYASTSPVKTTSTNVTTSQVVNGVTVNVTSAASSTNSTLPDTGCDLKVFFVWTGTDRNKNALKSSAKRFSRFRQYGVASAYQSAINLAVDAQNIAATAISAVESVPNRIQPAGLNRRRLDGEGEGEGGAPALGRGGLAPGGAVDETGAAEAEAAHAAAREAAAARERAAPAAREGWAARAAEAAAAAGRAAAEAARAAGRAAARLRASHAAGGA